MGRNRLNQGHNVPDYVDKFGLALAHFALKVRETKNIRHKGEKGSERELSVRQFFKELLPSKYDVVSGEVIDLLGNKSPQLDALIYDRSKNFPFYSGEYSVIPAEALLCSVEVKSTLTAQEAIKCKLAAGKLKSLRPGKRKLGHGSDPKRFRYFHIVFAYNTDLSEEKWAEKELKRFGAENRDEVDLIYVLERGLINVKSRTVLPENIKTGQALVALHFSISNFLDRENSRREAAPYFNYASDLNRFWEKISV